MFAHDVSREEEVDPPSAESESNRQGALPFAVPGPLGQPDLLRLVDLDDARILNDDLNVTVAHAAYHLHYLLNDLVILRTASTPGRNLGNVHGILTILNTLLDYRTFTRK